MMNLPNFRKCQDVLGNGLLLKVTVFLQHHKGRIFERSKPTELHGNINLPLNFQLCSNLEPLHVWVSPVWYQITYGLRTKK